MPIRQAIPSDRQNIQHLLTQLEYPGTANFLEEKLERMLQHPDEVLLVYEPVPGGSIEGLLSLHFIPQIALEGDFARISYFVVDENSQSGGIGREMEEYCTRLARERGCHLIEVHCHTRRERAHRFYYRQGFEESPKYLIKRLK